MLPLDATSRFVHSDETATLRAILASTMEGIVFVNEQGIVQFINPAAEKMFRLTTEQIVGRSINDLMPSPQNTTYDDLIAKHLAKGQSLIIGEQQEIDAKRSDGTPFQLHLSVSEVALSGGSRMFIGVMRDISKQKQSEQQIRDDAKRIRAILDTAVEGIVTINEQGIIEVFNRAAETIFCFTAEEVVGRNVRMLMPSPFREEHDGYITRYLTTGEKKIIGIGREVVGQRKDGSTFPMELSISEVRLDNHFLFTAAVRDISERKRMEARMMQAERLAAIGEAMTGLTHESRNALQRSQACLEMLKMVIEGNAKANDLIADIQRAQNDLHALYEDVKEYAAPLNLQWRLNDVGQIVREAWANLSHQRSGRTISFSEDHSDLGLQCNVDAFALRHVFQNIFDNSLAACADPVKVVVSYSECNIDNVAALQVSVRDNGPGLSPEAQKKVFEPFFTTKTKGTGLGMAICLRIILAHGGEITLVERNGQGAEFLMKIPRRHE
ncbi:Sensor protein FixL [Planctopirus ephydatiae]|uniref:Sensor protein FixL n=1 Tax=Planctopirus ephydatiae TaxID=2528019 RepID=A0A518GNS0_9PLAN|nr:PAS domain S-box protein [Planctopirus ephydatiae]QDV30282.1 Sensor protein FixL [Planctopirus ephydatiae]